MSDSILKLGNFKFRSTSSNVEVFFQDEIKDEVCAEEVEDNHSQAEIDEAYKQGIEETKSSLQPQIDALQTENAQIKSEFEVKISELANSFQSCFDNLENEFVDEVCTMGLKLAEMIIRQECTKKEQLLDLIKGSLKDIFTDSNIILKLNSEDMSFISENITSSKLTCEEDANLSPGEALINYNKGFVDLTLDSRMQVLKDHFESVKMGDNLAE